MTTATIDRTEQSSLEFELERLEMKHVQPRSDGASCTCMCEREPECGSSCGCGLEGT